MGKGLAGQGIQILYREESQHLGTIPCSLGTALEPYLGQSDFRLWPLLPLFFPSLRFLLGTMLVGEVSISSLCVFFLLVKVIYKNVHLYAKVESKLLYTSEGGLHSSTLHFRPEPQSLQPGLKSFHHFSNICHIYFYYRHLDFRI